MRSDGANLAPILYRLREREPLRYRLIVKQIARVLPNFKDFELKPAYDKLALRWIATGADKSFGAHLTSDGSLRLFCLLTLLNLPDEMLPDILFLDEPELGLHPHAISLLAEMIQRVANSRQVFLATQSPCWWIALNWETSSSLTSSITRRGCGRFPLRSIRLGWRMTICLPICGSSNR